MPAWTHETGLTVKRYGEWEDGDVFFIISLGNVSNISLVFFCRMPAWTHETGLTVKRYGEWGGVLFFIISLGNVSNVSPWFFL